jgi:hypothetical protein
MSDATRNSTAIGWLGDIEDATVSNGTFGPCCSPVPTCNSR